ncbi:hypothetical protein [Flavobacterium sp. GNP001]
MDFRKALLFFPFFTMATAQQIDATTNGNFAQIEKATVTMNLVTPQIDTIKSHQFVNSMTDFSSNEIISTVDKTRSPKILLMANFAKSWRVAASPDNLTAQEKKYYKELKSGSSFDIAAYYITNESNGVGLKYNVFRADAILRNQIIDFGGGNFVSGDIADDVKITFVGPSFIISDNASARLGEASLEIALGYMGYRNDASVVGNPLKITGGDVGMVGGFSYHFRLRPDLLIGPQLNFAGAVLKKLKYTYEDGSTQTIKLDEEEYENLWRIDLAIGAKFRF